MTEFESVLLKTLITNPVFFSKAMPILKDKHFKDIGNSQAFKIIKEHYDKYSQIPNNTEIISSIKNVPNAEIREQIKQSLMKIGPIESPSTEFMLDEVVTFVKDALYLEALELGSDGLMKRDETLKLKAEAIMDERAKIQIDSDLGLEFDDIEAMIEYYSERNIGLRTKSKEFNKRIGAGFLPKTLSLILAPSGIGKSLLKTHFVSDWLKENKKILLISLEMQDKEVMKRVHANALDLPINALGDLSKTEGELAQLDRPYLTKEQIINKFQSTKASGTLGKLYVKEYSPGGFSSNMLDALLQEYKTQKGIEFDVVLVDYLGIMKSDKVPVSAGLYSYVKSIAEELRAQAVKWNIPIISSSQLNRSAVNNTEADNSAVSDSIGSVQTADFMVFLLQNEEMKENSEITFKVTKNRFNGRTDTFMMNVDYEKMRFQDMVIEGSSEAFEIQSQNKVQDKVDDFGIITSSKQKSAEAFAEQEVKDIEAEGRRLINEIDKKQTFDSTDDILKELGLDI